MRVSSASAFSFQAKNTSPCRWLIVNCQTNPTVGHSPELTSLLTWYVSLGNFIASLSSWDHQRLSGSISWETWKSPAAEVMKMPSKEKGSPLGPAVAYRATALPLEDSRAPAKGRGEALPAPEPRRRYLLPQGHAPSCNRLLKELRQVWKRFQDQIQRRHLDK